MCAVLAYNNNIYKTCTIIFFFLCLKREKLNDLGQCYDEKFFGKNYRSTILQKHFNKTAKEVIAIIQLLIIGN